jgi:cytosine/adenosine deaminase-related metal-dependent hydrolase
MGQASAAGSNTAYNINTGLEVGSHADFITLDIGHPALTAVKYEYLI